MKLITKIDSNIPEAISTDRKRLMQILLNLLSNSAKYTFQGTVTLVVESKGQTVHFEVIDTGIGINENKKEELFKLFGKKQLDSKDSTQLNTSAGSGLGLTISQALVNLLGSGITFTSKVGEGSSFFFDINKMLKRQRSRSLRSRNLDGKKVPSFRRTISTNVPQPPEKDMDLELENPPMIRNDSLLSCGGAENISNDGEGDKRTQTRNLSDYRLVLKNSFSGDLPSVNRACKCPTMLIVDDNAFNLLVLNSLLAKIGISCETVS